MTPATDPRDRVRAELEQELVAEASRPNRPADAGGAEMHTLLPATGVDMHTLLPKPPLGH